MTPLKLHPLQSAMHSKVDLKPLVGQACRIRVDDRLENRTVTLLWNLAPAVEGQKNFEKLVIQSFDYHRFIHFFEVAQAAAQADTDATLANEIEEATIYDSGPSFDLIDSQGRVRSIKATFTLDGFCFQNFEVCQDGKKMQLTCQTPWMSYQQLIDVINSIVFQYNSELCLTLTDSRRKNNVDLFVDFSGGVRKALIESDSPQEYVNSYGHINSTLFETLPVYRQYQAYCSGKNFAGI